MQVMLNHVRRGQTPHNVSIWRPTPFTADAFTNFNDKDEDIRASGRGLGLVRHISIYRTTLSGYTLQTPQPLRVCAKSDPTFKFNFDRLSAMEPQLCVFSLFQTY